MSLWIIIPIKSLTEGKSRLIGVLDNQQRCLLNQYLMDRTLSLVSKLVLDAPILVISKCHETLESAKKYGVAALLENPVLGPNTAVQQATQYARQHGATKLFVLACDLPDLTAADFKEALALGDNPNSVLIIRNREQGTNGLYLNSTKEFNYYFGTDSLNLHIQEAQRRELAISFLQRHGLAFDLDTATDYAEFVGKSPLF